jgi:hypothetical protein
LISTERQKGRQENVERSETKQNQEQKAQTLRSAGARCLSSSVEYKGSTESTIETWLEAQTANSEQQGELRKSTGKKNDSKTEGERSLEDFSCG